MKRREFLFGLSYLSIPNFLGDIKYIPIKEYVKKPRILIFSGHTQKNYGTKSYNNKKEILYNDDIVNRIELIKNSDLEYICIDSWFNIDYKKRAKFAKKINADFYLEIHHDSIKLNDLKMAKKKDIENLLSDFEGFSLYIHPKNFFEESYKFSELIKNYLIENGLQLCRFYEVNKRWETISPGIYLRNKLYILNDAQVPTVILECGSIKIPKEEKYLSDDEIKLKIINSINKAFMDYFKS
ncbi:MAG: N-acetylmuramoyl-L-alanine amidase [Candidatus Aenigmatarchaeota archaeon]